MIILSGGEKGGCCKSTNAINLASEFAFRGYKVGLLDADKKLSSKNWTVVRDAMADYINTGAINFPLDEEFILEMPKAAMANIRKNGIHKIEGVNVVGNIIDTIKNMAYRNDILIIDVGGGDTSEFHMSLGMADLLICPLKPSILDFDTVPNLEKNLSLVKIHHPNLVVKTLIFDAPNSPMSKSIPRFKKALASTDHLNNVMNIIVKNRESYRYCLEWGLGVREWTDSNAKAEMSAVAQNIIDEFELTIEDS